MPAPYASEIDVSIITISTNEAHWLGPLYDSLRAAKPACAVEPILIDNGSDDDTARIATEEYPEVALIRQPAKRGFATNNNRGMAWARGRYILLLNPDTQLRPGVLEGMAALLDAQPRIGIAGCKLENPDGTTQETCRRFPDLPAVASRWGERYLPGWSRRWQDRYLMRDYDHAQRREVDWILGAFLFMRREALAETGLLDIRYDPLYYEDVDVCARMWRCGYSVVYEPALAITHHYHRESAATLLNRMAYHHIRNVFRFWLTHSPWLSARTPQELPHG